MNRTGAIVACALVVVGLGVAACGGNNEGNGTGGAGGTVTPPATTGGMGGAGGGGAGMGGGTPMGGAGGGGSGTPAGSYFPLKVGTVWTYRVTVPGSSAAPTYKVVTLEAQEMVGGVGASAGKMAYRHKTCKSAKTPEACGMPAGPANTIDQTVGWWGIVPGMNGNINVNYREQTFKVAQPELGPTEDDWWEPYRLRIDEQAAHIALGAKFTETFKELKKPTGGGPTTTTSQSIEWVVDAVDDTVMVTLAAGMTKSYPGCLKVSHAMGGAAGKSFWYCRGIGKVKELGGQTEELIDYKPAP